LSRPVFKAIDVADLGKRITLDIPAFQVQKAELEQAEEYQGPTVEEIEAQIAEMKAGAEAEFETRKQEAERRYEEIKAEAENNAFDRIKKATDEAKQKIGEAELRAREILSEAEIKAKEMVIEAESKVSEIESQARDRGYDDGRDKGYDEGKEEVSRLINSLNRIISATIERRNEIIKNVEQQLMMIVLLITRKVVKSISEHQKGIVMHNIREALSKVRGRTDVVIRVNIEDLELTTEHKAEFIKLVEDIKNVSILEDSTVDKGGCIIETDFGNIDARIASQFQEIEDRIKEVMPITIEDRQEDILR
jgi:flagellar assembly protein FliH